MGDRKLTLLELHFDGDPQFGPTFGNEMGSGEEASSEGSGGGSDLDLDVETGGSPVRGVLGLVLIFLVVVAVKKLLGGNVESDLGD